MVSLVYPAKPSIKSKLNFKMIRKTTTKTTTTNKQGNAMPRVQTSSFKKALTHRTTDMYNRIMLLWPSFDIIYKENKTFNVT
jgi:hypothetical protein